MQFPPVTNCKWFQSQLALRIYHSAESMALHFPDASLKSIKIYKNSSTISWITLDRQHAIAWLGGTYIEYWIFQGLRLGLAVCITIDYLNSARLSGDAVLQYVTGGSPNTHDMHHF